MILRWLALLREKVPLLVIVSTFIWSAVMIARYRARESPPDSITIRIGHWQLESGVRVAFDALAEDFRREVDPRVHVVQDAIPEGIYGQWASTQLMGGTAPDLVEIGKGLPAHVWVSYLNRYFLPLSRDASRPNPFNADTPMRDQPWRATYRDGMRAGYVDELQEHMMAPLSQFAMRVFYNKDLLRRLTGMDRAPANYREFITACEMIGRHRDEHDQRYTPIACSTFHFGMWDGMLFDAMTYRVLRRADFNRDGIVSNDENFAAFRAGRLSFDEPAIQAKFRMTREVCSYFQPGFTGISRDEAVFLFAQQRAVFMTTGTWDAGSLREQAKGQFDVGVMDFPMPAVDDPEFGPLVDGPRYDRPFVGCNLAILRNSRHPEVALKFLQYITARRGNEKFNHIAGWIPAVRDTAMPEILEGFEPKLRGVYGTLNLFLGGETWLKWSQLYSLFQIGQISYQDMAQQFQPFYLERGLRDYQELQRDWQRGMVVNEQVLAGLRAAAMKPGIDTEKSRELWAKYRSLIRTRQLQAGIYHARQMHLVEQGPREGAVGPYEYTDAARAALSQRNQP